MPDIMLFALGGYLTVGLLIAAASAVVNPPGLRSAGEAGLYALYLLVAVLIGPAVALFDLMRRD